MPMYRFKCRNGHASDLVQLPSDEAPACFRCNEPTKREFPNPTFKFGADVHQKAYYRMQEAGEVK